MSLPLAWPQQGTSQETPWRAGVELRDEPADRTLAQRSNRPGFPSLRPPITQPGWPSPGNEWRLNVHADESDIGMLISSVVPGGAGARAGLGRGDRIITVAGQQVGFVGRRSVSLRDEIQRRVDSRGEVLLLVQNRRDRSLRNVAVRLDRSSTQPQPFGR